MKTGKDFKRCVVGNFETILPAIDGQLHLIFRQMLNSYTDGEGGDPPYSSKELLEFLGGPIAFSTKLLTDFPFRRILEETLAELDLKHYEEVVKAFGVMVYA